MRKRFLISFFISLIFQNVKLFSQQVSFAPVIYKSEKDVYGFLGITQDRLGNIWLTSYDGGLYRYDGSGFINFQHNDTIANSVASDHTECIFADSSDLIWIGTFGQGLDRYNPVINLFTHFRHNANESLSLGNDTVTAILQDREGNIWVGTYGGLDLFNPLKGTFKHYAHNPNNRSGLSSNRIRSLYEDHQGTLWIGCGENFSNNGATTSEEGGLNRFNRTDGTFTQYKHEPGNPNSLETNKVKALFEDSRGNFWVGTSGNGLNLMDRTKGTFTHYYYDSLNPDKLSRPPVSKSSVDHITFIGEDILGGLWIGSYSGGINRYDTVTKKTTHFGKLASSLKPLQTLGVDTSSGYTDFGSWNSMFSPDGQIWITALHPIAGSLFYHASIIPKGIPFYPTVGMGGVNSFYYQTDSILWIGTDSGLIEKNMTLKTEKILRNEPGNPNSLGNTTINVIRVDRERNFWLGTNGGLTKYNPTTNHYTRLAFNEKIKSSLCNDTVVSICIDHNDDLWVGSFGGLDKLDKNSGGFTHFKLENRLKLSYGNATYCIREDRNNRLWVGTEGGLYRIDISTGFVTTVLPSANTRSICVDSKNVVWIGSDTGGIIYKQNLYRLTRNQFVLFTDPNRQASMTDIFDIMEDRHQNLWVSTTNAIFRINDQRDAVRKFGPEYGVHKNGFTTGDNFEAANGMLFFGDSHGYYSFHPDGIAGNSHIQLNFTSFKLHGGEVVPSENGILQEPVWRTEEIRLAYNENNFSFEFAGIDYQISGEIRYMFMLENYDNDWVTYGNGHRSIYFNIPPGGYTFKVRAFSADGSMSEKTIRIIISPPWWKTWWAYIIFSLLAIGAVWGFIVYRSRKLLAENKLLEEKVNSRTKQLNLSLKELKSTQNQLIQSEKMASLGELTAGIAHEIQNPLNFVNNFSEINSELIAEMKEEITKGNMEEIKSLALHLEENEKKIVHHGKRADAIVKGMLQHSRTSSAVKELTDLNKLVDEYLRLSYHGLRAKDKSFNADLQTDYDHNLVKINIIPQDIGRVLLNLFNNAFYAVAEKKQQQPDGYKPMVRVSTALVDDQMEIKISDNGNGISQKILDKIFQPFFTTKPTGQGTGLGLSLSYDIIKAHGGILKVETKEGEGAAFKIQIPLA